MSCNYVISSPVSTCELTVKCTKSETKAIDHLPQSVQQELFSAAALGTTVFFFGLKRRSLWKISNKASTRLGATAIPTLLAKLGGFVNKKDNNKKNGNLSWSSE